MKIVCLILSSLLIWRFDIASAKVACETDDVCVEKLRKGSTCVDGFCTNPFSTGCLRRYLGEDEFPSLRVCNSDDPLNAENEGLCSNEPLRYLNYTEIRIHPADWDSAIFLAWIYQIVLSELMNVPVSIERGGGKGPNITSLSFYDMGNSYGDSFPVKKYSFDGLEKSNEVRDCKMTTEACAHVLPEVWDPIEFELKEVADELLSGHIAVEGFWLPSYTIRKEPSFGTYFGLQGEDNREKLARTFKRPTTWGDYCTYVSNCTSDDGVAVRKPANVSERGKYFAEGSYNGYFRYTEKNNCSENSNCTGHIVDYPCNSKWDSYTEQQMFWNYIHLEAENSVEHYSEESIREIFYAANTTQSDIIALWWRPESTFLQFDYIKISLPYPTKECVKSVRPTIDRCTGTHEQLVGEQVGACDYEVQPLKKIIARSLQEEAFKTRVDIRSPAYQFIQSFTFQNTQVEEVLQTWFQRNIDRDGYDPRESVCSYIATHLDDFKAFVPHGYPRKIGKTNDQHYYNDPLVIFAIAFGCFSSVIMLLTLAGTIYFRDHKLMKSARIEYLYLFCLGYLLVSLGAVAYSLKPSDAVCIAKVLMVHFGYTVALVPLAVKLSAINRLQRHARMMKRKKVSQNTLWATIVFLLSLAFVYLIVWTVVDPPTMGILMVLQDGSGYVVDVDIYCKSNDRFWGGVAIGWEGVLICYSFVQAWQANRSSRMKKLTELQMARNMAYVSFVVFVFRSVVFYLPDVALKPQRGDCAESILLSIDSLLSILVYFGPKFLIIRSKDHSRYQEDRISGIEGSTAEVACPHCKGTIYVGSGHPFWRGLQSGGQQ